MKTSKFLIIALCLFAIPVHATPPPEPTLDFIREIFALPQQGPPPIGNLPGGSGAVSSVFTRTGAVTASSGDYTCAQVTNCIATNQTNVYGAFLQDFTAATMEIPEAAGFVATVNSTIGLDTTANSEHTWVNSADAINAVEAAGITANVLPKSTDATHGLITASLATDDGTSLTYTGTGGITASAGPLTSGSDGVHPGSVSLPCQTTLPALTANTVTLLGCPGATNTAWSLQLPTAIPVTNDLFSCVVTSTNCALTDSGILTTNIVRINQANVYGAFLQDFTAGTMEIPEAAGFTTNVNSTIGLDTTANAVHLWVNGADSISVVEAAGVVANTLLKSTDATHGLTTASSVIDNGTTVTSTDTGGFVAPVFVSNGATAGFVDYAQGTTSAAVAPCNTATSICWQAPTAVTSYLGVFPGTAATGFPFWTNAANVVTESIITMANGTMPNATSASAVSFTATPTLGVVSTTTGSLSIANSGNAFLNIWGSNSGTTATNTIAGFAAVPATNVVPKCVVATTVCTLTASLITDNGTTATYTGTGGYSAPILVSSVALGTAPLTVTSATPVANLQPAFLRATMTADWTCGTGGTVSSCVAATIVGSTGVPMTITLPSSALSWDFDCDGVATDTTGTPANNWNMLTATNGATNVTAYYMMGTAQAVGGFGATTDQASTTTTFSIGGTWTLGAAGTKFPFHIHARIEGASASGTVVSLQVVDPTVADLLTIYRGMSCWAHQ